MWRPLSFFVCVFMLSLGIRAPASLLDAWLQNISSRELGIADIQGGLWQGSGRLATRDPENGLFVPLTPITWSWRPLDLLHLRFGWSFSVGGLPPFSLALSPRGPVADSVSIKLPMRDLLDQVPGTLAAAGWRGDINLDVAHWQCNWSGQCTGEAEVFWRGASSDLFPGRALGNYHLSLLGQGERVALNLETLGQAEVRINATGQWMPKGNSSLQGAVEGDPAFVGRLPDVAGRWVRKTAVPGKLLFSFNN